jgi:hypothetical protein
MPNAQCPMSTHGSGKRVDDHPRHGHCGLNLNGEPFSSLALPSSTGTLFEMQVHQKDRLVTTEDDRHRKKTTPTRVLSLSTSS